MLKYIAKRIISMIPVVIMITMIIFGLVKAMPGDPARMMVSPALKAEAFELPIRRCGQNWAWTGPCPDNACAGWRPSSKATWAGRP